MAETAIPSIVLFIGAVVGTGCFAVEKIDPASIEASGACASLLVDDFETRDLVPTSRLFGSWQCKTFNSIGPDEGVSCSVESSDTGLALAANFLLRDAPDGIQSFPAAAVTAFVVGKPLDLRRYHWLLFDVRVDSGMPPLPAQASTSFVATFGCSTVARRGAANPGEPAGVDQSIVIAPHWQSDRLELDNFGQPSEQTNAIVGGAPSCLGAVDRFEFSIDVPVQDGESAAGTIHLDNITLYGDCQ